MIHFYRVKAYKKGNGVAINIIGNVCDTLFIKPGEYEIGREGDNLVMKAVKGGVLYRIGGQDCFTWQDVEYMAGKMREKEAAENAAEREDGDGVAR